MSGSHLRGKTYEEIYGVERAEEIRAMRQRPRPKMSEIMRGRKASVATKKKISIALRGHKQSEETKRKLRESANARWQGDDLRNIIIASNKRRRGSAQSQETREKISAGIKRHLERDLDCVCAIHLRQPRGETRLERILKDILTSDLCGKIEAEVRFGRYVVDFYSRAYHTAFEADGVHWHNEASDYIRDSYLMEKFDLPVIRFTESELLRLQG